MEENSSKECLSERSEVVDTEKKEFDSIQDVEKDIVENEIDRNNEGAKDNTADLLPADPVKKLAEDLKKWILEVPTEPSDLLPPPPTPIYHEDLVPEAPFKGISFNTRRSNAPVKQQFPTKKEKPAPEETKISKKPEEDLFPGLIKKEEQPRRRTLKQKETLELEFPGNKWYLGPPDMEDCEPDPAAYSVVPEFKKDEGGRIQPQFYVKHGRVYFHFGDDFMSVQRKIDEKRKLGEPLTEVERFFIDRDFLREKIAELQKEEDVRKRKAMKTDEAERIDRHFNLRQYWGCRRGGYLGFIAYALATRSSMVDWFQNHYVFHSVELSEEDKRILENSVDFMEWEDEPQKKEEIRAPPPSFDYASQFLWDASSSEEHNVSYRDFNETQFSHRGREQSRHHWNQRSRGSHRDFNESQHNHRGREQSRHHWNQRSRARGAGPYPRRTNYGGNNH